MPLCFFSIIFSNKWIAAQLIVNINTIQACSGAPTPARSWGATSPSRAPMKPCRNGGSHIHHMICCVLSPGEYRTQSKVMRELAQLHLGARVWNDACLSFSKADLLLLKWLRSYICLLRLCLYAFASEVNGKYKIDSRLGERLASMMQPRPGRA